MDILVRLAHGHLRMYYSRDRRHTVSHVPSLQVSEPAVSEGSGPALVEPAVMELVVSEPALVESAVSEPAVSELALVGLPDAGVVGDGVVVLRLLTRNYLSSPPPTPIPFPFVFRSICGIPSRCRLFDCVRIRFRGCNMSDYVRRFCLVRLMCVLKRAIQ